MEQKDNDRLLAFLKKRRPVFESALKQNEANIFFDYTTNKDYKK